MPTYKELTTKESLFSSGHRLCPGCGEAIIIRQILLSAPAPIVIIEATGCAEVCTTVFPTTAWNTPWIHSAFENAASTASGVVGAYNFLKKKKLLNQDINFLAFAGDGGTYDIGFQALSGALERGERFVFVCLNNEAYMNTGIQRSGATPQGVLTTTTPGGKKEQKKDIIGIVASHHIPYAAQISISHPQDLFKKIQKAFSCNGPAFINAICPCPLGWGYDSSLTVLISKLAVETGIWQLIEVEDGSWKINYKPKVFSPVEEFLKLQKRYKPLLENELLLQSLKQNILKSWERIENFSRT